jgi:hypothetical protein
MNRRIPRIGRSVFAPDSHEPDDREIPPEEITVERVEVIKVAVGLKPAGALKFPRRLRCLKCERLFKSEHKLNRLCVGCCTSNAHSVDPFTVSARR